MKPVTPQEDSILKRYEWRDDNRVIGFVDYYVFDEVCMIMHTEVLPALAGRGLGSQLAGKMIEHVEKSGKNIVPICGFFAQYLRRNSQHHNLVTLETRRIFNIAA